MEETPAPGSFYSRLANRVLVGPLVIGLIVVPLVWSWGSAGQKRAEFVVLLLGLVAVMMNTGFCVYCLLAGAGRASLGAILKAVAGMILGLLLGLWIVIGLFLIDGIGC